MEKSKHKLKKELKRAERHKDWLRKNLPNTKMEKENQKQILKLINVIKCKNFSNICFCLLNLFNNHVNNHL